MRGADVLQESLFTVRKLDDFVPASHPLRPIRERVNEALVRLDGLLAPMYADDAKGGQPSIAPEKLLRAMLLQVFYSIRSERQLMEQIQYNLLFRWFVGLAMDDAAWVPTVFSKNRDWLMDWKPGRCHINLGLITIDPFLPQQRALKTGGFSAAC